MSNQITSQRMNPVECEIVLQCMFASDKNHSYNVRQRAYESPGTWQGNGVIDVMHIADDESEYVIRYTFPGKAQS